MILSFAAIYALIYMFAVGIITYYPGLVSLKISTPVFNTSTDGITIIPFSYVFIFMFYYTIAFLIVSSFLVGLNIALLFYSRKVIITDKSCDSNSKGHKIMNINIGLRGISGIIPAFSTSFACCGGGLLTLAIGSTAFSSLAIYSKYMAPLTIAVLAAGTILMSRKISNQLAENRSVVHYSHDI